MIYEHLRNEKIDELSHQTRKYKRNRKNRGRRSINDRSPAKIVALRQKRHSTLIIGLGHRRNDPSILFVIAIIIVC